MDDLEVFVGMLCPVLNDAWIDVDGNELVEYLE